MTTLDIEKVPERKWEQAFLKALTTSPNVSKAAKAAGVTRQYVYAVRKDDPAFAQAWDDALETAIDALEERAYAMALTGETPVLTIFLLKGRRREIYGDQAKVDLNNNVSISGSVNFYIPSNGREQPLLEGPKDE